MDGSTPKIFKRQGVAKRNNAKARVLGTGGRVRAGMRPHLPGRFATVPEAPGTKPIRLGPVSCGGKERLVQLDLSRRSIQVMHELRLSNQRG